MTRLHTGASENRCSHIETLKARLEHFYTIPKQIGKGWESALAITVTLMELDMLRKQYVQALKLNYVKEQILVEGGRVFHVKTKV